MPGFVRFVVVSKSKRIPPKYYIDTIIEVEKEDTAVFVVKANNKPGVLAGIATVISNAGKNIAKIGVPDKPSKGTAYLYLVVEGCDENCAEELKNSIISLDGVLEAEYYLPIYGYLIPEYSEIKFLDNPALIFTQDMIARYAYYVLTKGGRSLPVVNEGYLTHVAYLGLAIGESLYEFLSKYIPEDMDIEEQYKALLELFKAFMNAMGYGKVVIDEAVPGRRYTVTFKRGAVECRGLYKYHFNIMTGKITEGILEAFFRRMTGRRAIATEKKCINKMNPDCVFEVEIVETLFPL